MTVEQAETKPEEKKPLIEFDEEAQAEPTGDEVETPEGEEQAETTAFEVVRKSGEGSQPTKPSKGRGIRKRINRANAKTAEANQKADELAQALEREQQKTKLLELRQQQLEGAGLVNKAPDPMDFDGGTEDPEFIQRNQAFQQAQREQERAEIVKEATQQILQQTTQADQTRSYSKKQEKHYDLAEEMGTKDFEAKEDKAYDILGDQMANHIIDNFPGKSHLVLYYLGTERNETEARELAGLLNDPNTLVQGIAEIGGLIKDLEIKPVSTTDTPDPDEPIEGGTPTGSEHAIRQREKLIKKAQDGGKDAMNNLIKFTKEMKAKGVVFTE